MQLCNAAASYGFLDPDNPTLHKAIGLAVVGGISILLAAECVASVLCPRIVAGALEATSPEGAAAVGGIGGAAHALDDIVESSISAAKAGRVVPSITVNHDFQFGGAGRSGSKVKDFVGPPNAVVRGASECRVFVTDDQGRVIFDITRDRVKPVVPGRGFESGSGRKLTPTQTQLEWINDLWG